jgi:hypothetical protein
MLVADIQGEKKKKNKTAQKERIMCKRFNQRSVEMKEMTLTKKKKEKVSKMFGAFRRLQI